MKYVVLTSPGLDKQFKDEVKKLGLSVFFYPTISFKKIPLLEKNQSILKEEISFNWIIFTSKTAVNFFSNSNPGLELEKCKIATVGEETAKELEKYQIKTDFIPKRFTAKNLAKNLPIKQGEKILLPRSDIANTNLPKLLTKRGAKVTDLPIYKTELNKKSNPGLEKIILTGETTAIVFTSPSTAKGFLNGLSSDIVKNAAKNCLCLSIGPVTTQTLKKSGFKKIFTADIHTTEGILKKLQAIYT
jgi:uroporphyrinogen-III synthase